MTTANDSTTADDPENSIDADVPASEHDLTAWDDGIESSADRGDGSAYVAEVVGEHPKYGIDRDFLSEKHDGGARSLPVQRIDIHDVVEVQHCDADPERTYQYIDGMTVEDGHLVDIETTVLDGQDEAIKALDWTGSGERQQLMDEIENQLGALDTGELRTVARQMGSEGDAGDPAEKATVHPADLPDDVRREVTRMRKAFRTAYQDHLGVAPDEDTRAALIDAALLVEKQRRE